MPTLPKDKCPLFQRLNISPTLLTQLQHVINKLLMRKNNNVDIYHIYGLPFITAAPLSHHHHITVSSTLYKGFLTRSQGMYVIPHFFDRLKLNFTRLLKLKSFVVSDEISAERYFKIPNFLVLKRQF